ncbi:flagellar assembly protein FliW [Treponema sp. TIM-1]|uniref:flagellar assembly protein FliW n=1 Tax=Treponema sp. TIM-1 TaxID=2898417 RepID=UPI00397FFE8D
MKVATKAYGIIEVDERQKITFPAGLFGFEGIRDYILLDAERQPFYWLQALEVEELAFILINPFLFRPDYEVEVDDGEFREIGLSDPKMALTFSIVTIPPEGPMTANLQGPLIINRESRLGKQAILTDTRWKTKHDIMEELASVKGTDAAKKAPC